VRNHTWLALIAVLVLTSAPTPAAAKHLTAGEYKHPEDYYYTLKSIFIDIQVKVEVGGWIAKLHAQTTASPVPVGTGDNVVVWRNYGPGRLSTPPLTWHYTFDGSYTGPHERLEDEYFSIGPESPVRVTCAREWDEEHRVTGRINPHHFQVIRSLGKPGNDALFPLIGHFPNLVSNNFVHFDAEGAFPELDCRDAEGNGFTVPRSDFEGSADYSGALLGGPEKQARFDFPNWRLCVSGLGCSRSFESWQYIWIRSSGGVRLRLDKVVVHR
jgi:hypothetical protein